MATLPVDDLDPARRLGRARPLRLLPLRPRAQQGADATRSPPASSAAPNRLPRRPERGRPPAAAGPPQLQPGGAPPHLLRRRDRHRALHPHPALPDPLSAARRPRPPHRPPALGRAVHGRRIGDPAQPARSPPPPGRRPRRWRRLRLLHRRARQVHHRRQQLLLQTGGGDHLPDLHRPLPRLACLPATPRIDRRRAGAERDRADRRGESRPFQGRIPRAGAGAAGRGTGDAPAARPAGRPRRGHRHHAQPGSALVPALRRRRRRSLRALVRTGLVPPRRDRRLRPLGPGLDRHHRSASSSPSDSPTTPLAPASRRTRSPTSTSSTGRRWSRPPSRPPSSSSASGACCAATGSTLTSG